MREADQGVQVAELCKKHGISDVTLARWRKQYGGLSASELRRLKELEWENRQLKQLVADLSLDKQILQEVVAKKL